MNYFELNTVLIESETRDNGDSRHIARVIINLWFIHRRQKSNQKSIIIHIYVRS